MAVSMQRWVNKVAVVTGTSSGIGEAIAKVFVEEGLLVVGFARREDRLKELSKKLQNKKGKFHYVIVDVSKEEDIKKGFEWTTKNVGPVHILVNNAGIAHTNTLVDGDADKWRQVLDVNVLGLSICTREAINVMNANNIDGHIIHINSIAGHFVPNFPGLNIYAASKFAVTALRETLECELKQMKRNIRVTSVSPGLVQTEIVSKVDGKDLPDALQEEYKTALIPEDIAEAVKYAVSTPQRVLVVGFARREDRLKELSKKLQNKKGKFHYVIVDVSKEEDIKKGFEWTTKNVGPVHILVNNAGIAHTNTLVDGDADKWRQVLDVNVLGLSICTREAINVMNANNIDGHIIHINSIAGHFVPNFPGLNIYAASKFAVTALRETLECELKQMKRNIRVTSVSPGLVQTEIVSKVDGKDLPDALQEEYKTALIPEDIAEAVKYAVSTPQRVLIRELTITPSKGNL